MELSVLYFQTTEQPVPAPKPVEELDFDTLMKQLQTCLHSVQSNDFALSASTDNKQDGSTTESVSKQAAIEQTSVPETGAIAEASVGTEEEQMDCEEAMDIDEDPIQQPATESNPGHENVVKCEEEIKIETENKTPEQIDVDSNSGGKSVSSKEKEHCIITENIADEIQEIDVKVQDKIRDSDQQEETEGVGKRGNSGEDNGQQPKSKDESSDEEFLSADEDSPEQTPPKVGYSINFDDLETANPFASKSGLVNSPDNVKPKAHKDELKMNGKHSDSTKMKTEATANKEKPISPEITPVIKTEQYCESSSEIESTEDVKEEKAQSPAAPVSESEASLVKEGAPETAETEPTDSPERIPPKAGYSINFDDLDMMDPFATKSGVANSPVIGANKSFTNSIRKTKCGELKKDGKVDESLMPETTAKESVVEKNKDEKFHSANTSPEKDDGKETSSSTSAGTCKDKVKRALLDEESTVVADVDLKKQIKNSPVKNTDTDEKHEEKTDKDKKQPVRKNKQNDKKQNTDISEIKDTNTENKIDEIPVTKGTYNFDDIDFDSIDPFKPKKQMMNSPDIAKANTEESLSVQSPAPSSCRNISKKLETDDVDMEADIDKTHGRVASEKVTETEKNAVSLANEEPLPALEDIDPFKPRNQMQNSPVAKEHNVMNDFEFLDDVDPFKPRKQMQNSPVTTKSDVVTSIDQLEEEDPFKPKKQIENSPAAQEKATLTNDLPEGDHTDITNVATAAEACINNNALDCTDPFMSVSKVVNTPEGKDKPTALADAFEDLDPFKTKSKVASTPDKEAGCNKPVDNGDTEFDGADPFKPRNQMANSPACDPFATKAKIAQSPQVNKQQPTVSVERFVLSIQGSR